MNIITVYTCVCGGGRTSVKECILSARVGKGCLYLVRTETAAGMAVTEEPLDKMLRILDCDSLHSDAVLVRLG